MNIWPSFPSQDLADLKVFSMVDIAGAGDVIHHASYTFALQQLGFTEPQIAIMCLSPSDVLGG